MAPVAGGDATLRVATADGQLVVAFAGQLDIAGVRRLQPEVDDLLARPPAPVVVDLEGVDFMDSSGLAMLLGLVNRFGPLQVRRASPIIRRVITGTGLTEQLRVEP